jgi:hypothetical protein
MEVFRGDAGTANYSDALDLRDHRCFPRLALLNDRQTISDTEAWEDASAQARIASVTRASYETSMA